MPIVDRPARSKKFAATTIGCISILVLAACGREAPPPPPPTFDTEAYVGIPSPYFAYDHSLKDLTCDTTGKWESIHTGLPVTLKHGGDTVAESQLGAGFNTIRTCQFNFKLKGVPELDGDYVVEVGDVLRQTMDLDALKVHIFEVRTS